MSQLQQPGEFDAVLGNPLTPPIAGVVLGGMAGVRQRFGSKAPEERMAAVLSALNYGEAGLEILFQALQDPLLQVQRLAYRLLRTSRDASVRQVLRDYDVYALLECIGILRGHQGGVTAVAISEDGRSLVSAGRDAVMRVWDVQTQEEYLTIQQPRFVYAIAISDDNRTCTVKQANSVIKAWDLRTGQQLEAAPLPTRSIASVAVSPSRQQTAHHLISGSQNLIKIWNLKRGREVATLRGHTSLVTAVAIARRRPLVVSGSEDRTIRVWGVP